MKSKNDISPKRLQPRKRCNMLISFFRSTPQEKYQLHEILLLASMIVFTLIFMLWGVLEVAYARMVVDEPAITPEVVMTTDIVEPEEPEPVEVIEPEPEVVYEQLWTNKDALVLTKMLYGEARGVDILMTRDGRAIGGDCQKAAVIWTVLNRYDAGFEESIYEVVTARKQFVGYKSSNPIDENLFVLVCDVLDRWNREKHGETDVGRVIPSDYYWFVGDGDYNWFTNEFRSGDYWDWTLTDIYMEE